MAFCPPQETYARLLLHHRHGYPLWVPEPNMSLPQDIYSQGVLIGDVGLINEYGDFTSLFNIFLDSSHPVNTVHGVPAGFQPLQIHRNLFYSRDNYHHAKVPISSKHTREVMFNADGTVLATGMPVGPGIGVELQFSRSQGAALMLPEGALRVDYRGLPDMRDYAARNAESWYQFLTEQVRMDAHNGSLYLVTGHDKTNCYENIAFSNSSKECSICLRFSSPLLANGDFGRLKLSYSSSDAHMPSMQASHPQHTLKNLSVFIRGFKIMIRRPPWLWRPAVKVMDVTKADPKEVMYRGPVPNIQSAASSSQPSAPSSDAAGGNDHSATSSSAVTSSRKSATSHSAFDTESGSPDSSFSDRGSSILDSDSEDVVYKLHHPLDVINEHMLEMFPEARFAITHDEQWILLLNEKDDEYPGDQVLLTRMKDNFQIKSDQGYVLLVDSQGSILSPSHSKYTDANRTNTLSRILKDTAEALSQDLVFSVQPDPSESTNPPSDLEQRLFQYGQEKYWGKQKPAILGEPVPATLAVQMLWAAVPKLESSNAIESSPGQILGPKMRSQNIARLPACVRCKRLKRKCVFPEDSNTCRKCKFDGQTCIVEGRKSRSGPNKQKYLLAQISQKDAMIASLLKQLNSQYIAVTSFGLAISPSDDSGNNDPAWLQSSVRSQRVAIRNTTQDQDHFATVRGAQETVEGDEGDTKSLYTPLGLLAGLGLGNSEVRAIDKADVKQEAISSEERDLSDDINAASEIYSAGLDRTALIKLYNPPEILANGLVTPDDVDKLFEIFYKKCNLFIPLLDPVLHTPASIFARCPFLLTVICAISLRYYPKKHEVYPIAMYFAKRSAGTAFIQDRKSVELCQAYILMSVYAAPTSRWEEDRSWIYTGLAIRLAIELNLHHIPVIKPQNERQEREMLNRMRVWIICFNLDHSLAIQSGKSWTIEEDYFIRNSEEWYKYSRYSLAHDVYLCFYSALMQLLACFHGEIFSDPSTPDALDKTLDLREVILKYDECLTRCHQEWEKRFAEELSPEDGSSAFRYKLLPFYVAYSRLVMYSFGFHQMLRRGIQSQDDIFPSKCFEAAKAVIKTMLLELVPTGYIKYAPNEFFIISSFASASLLKLLRPEFSHLLRQGDKGEILDLIARAIHILSSPHIAVDDRHTPKLHARFLARLLSRHRRDGNVILGHLRSDSSSQQSSPVFSLWSSPQSGCDSYITAPAHSVGGEVDATSLEMSFTNKSPVILPDEDWNMGM